MSLSWHRRRFKTCCDCRLRNSQQLAAPDRTQLAGMNEPQTCVSVDAKHLGNVANREIGFTRWRHSPSEGLINGRENCGIECRHGNASCNAAPVTVVMSRGMR